MTQSRCLIIAVCFFLGIVSNIPRPQGLEHSKQKEIYQELTQLKSGLGEWPEARGHGPGRVSMWCDSVGIIVL